MKKRLADDVIIKIKENKIPQKLIIDLVESKYEKMGIEHKPLTQSSLSKYINQSALIEWELEGIIIEVIEDIIRETKKKYRSNSINAKNNVTQDEYTKNNEESEESVVVILYNEFDKNNFFDMYDSYFDDDIQSSNEEFANRLYEISLVLELDFPFPLIEGIYEEGENGSWSKGQRPMYKENKFLYFEDMVHASEKERIFALEKLVEQGAYFKIPNMTHIPEVIDGGYTVIWLDANSDVIDETRVQKKWGIVLSYPDDIK